MLELAVVQKMLPKGHATHLTQEFLDKVEASVSDPAIADAFKENFITYLNVCGDSRRFTISDYINAVKFVSCKLMGKNLTESYAITFPERFAKYQSTPLGAGCYAAMYNKTKLVTKIYEQSLIPTYVLNAPLHQEALNKLAEIMNDDSVKGLVKVKACEAILAYTKAPEKSVLSIEIEQTDAINDLRQVTEELANSLRQSLNNGSSLKDVSTMKLIKDEDDIVDIEPLELPDLTEM